MDLKTGDFTGGAPEDTVMGAAVGDVGHFYGLPTQCGVNSSGAKQPGWQSALDDVTTTFLSMAAGVAAGRPNLARPGPAPLVRLDPEHYRLVADFDASSNQSMLADSVMVSGPLVNDEPAGKKASPPRGTLQFSHGAAWTALVALIV